MLDKFSAVFNNSAEVCELILTQFCSSQFKKSFFLIAIVNVIGILNFFLYVISWWSCIVVVDGDCSYGNSCIGGGGLQYGGQISSLIIMSSLSSNVGGNGDDGLCFASSCSNTFSNTVGIPEIIANTIKDVWTIKFKNEIILSLVYQII